MTADAAPQSVSVLPDELNQALLEFDLMLRYALSEGLEFDQPTRNAITNVQQMLMAAKVVSVVGPPSPTVIRPPEPSFPESPKPPFVVPSEPDFADALMVAHAALAKLIAPVTPLSLAATQPTERLGYLGNPPLIFWMIVIAIISVIGFVISGAILDLALAHARPMTSSMLQTLNWCFAASLGAVFYVLFTSLRYVSDRTYDPRYNSIYIIRFALGIVAGLILAVVLKASYSSGADNSTIKTIKNLGPAVIALLGGFSTEAVYQILQRMVDMLLAAVRGDQSDAATAKATNAARTELLKMADDMPDPIMKSKVLAAVKKVGA